jgi:hypothetical protein
MSNRFPRRLGVVVVTALMAATLPNLRSQQTPQLEMVRTDAVPISEPVPRYLLVPPRCDAQGNAYFRFSPVLPSQNPPVTKISPNGKVVTKFSLNSVPDTTFTQGAAVRGFAVDDRERVHLLASKDGKAFIVIFSAQGDFESTIPLSKPDFYPTQLTVFSSGAFLVSGVVQTNDSLPVTGRPFSAVFDNTGELVKEIMLPAISSTEGQIAISVPGGLPGEPVVISYLKILQATAGRLSLAGDDGYVYLILRTFPPTVYVLAPDGSMVRNLEINPPSGDVFPLAPAEAAGKLLVPYVRRIRPGRRENELTGMIVYDAGTGEELARYNLSHDLEGYFSCYSLDSVTFFEVVGKGAALIHGAPR